jgi:hypothetical protein
MEQIHQAGSKGGLMDMWLATLQSPDSAVAEQAEGMFLRMLHLFGDATMEHPNVIPTADANSNRPLGAGEDKIIASLVSDPSCKPSRAFIWAYKASSNDGMRSGKARGGDGLLVERERKKTCEGCQLKGPSFGLPAEGKKKR